MDEFYGQGFFDEPDKTCQQKQIEEMAKDIINIDVYDCDKCKGCDKYGYNDECDDECFSEVCAEYLYNAGYRKIPENAAVLTEALENKGKETAKEIYNELCGHGTTYVKKWIKERYNLEVE